MVHVCSFWGGGTSPGTRRWWVRVETRWGSGGWRERGANDPQKRRARPARYEGRIAIFEIHKHTHTRMEWAFGRPCSMKSR